MKSGITISLCFTVLLTAGTVFYQSALFSEEETLAVILHLCLWDDPETTVRQRIRELNQKVISVPPEKYKDYTNDILQFLLHINQDSAEDIQLYRTRGSLPARDFLFYRHRLCCISLSYTDTSPGKYQSIYSYLKKTFGSPETGRTDVSVTHTFLGDGTAVQMNTEQGHSRSMNVHISLYPPDIFSRILKL